MNENETNALEGAQEKEAETKPAKTGFFTKVKNGVKNGANKVVGYAKEHKVKVGAVVAGAGLAAYGVFKMLSNAKGEDEYDPEAEFEPGDWEPEEDEEEETPEETSVEEEVPEE